MKIASVLLICLILLQNLNAQNFKIGASVCGSNYSGDLTSNNSAIIKQTSPGFGLFLNYSLDDYFGIKLQYERLKVSANDALSNQDWQIRRNLNFKSQINTFDLFAQINLRSILFSQINFCNVYLIGGYSIFSFNPITNYNGREIELKPLGTEGQGMIGFKPKYNLIAGAFNFGISIEYLLNPLWSIQSQLLYRKTNTDYLDDISNAYIDFNLLSQKNGQIAAELGNKINAPQGSQRGNPLDQDWFQSLNISLNYKIFDRNSKEPTRKNKRSVHCPKI
ncbi:MAG: DUF6089 family protein [Saprospiraceae bacterium]